MNRSDPVRPSSLVRLRLTAGLVAAVGIGLALLIFVPPLFAKFTSDTFYLYERALAQSPNDIAALFAPGAHSWYRPVTDLVFWFEVRAFGQNPVGYHLVALASHFLCTALVFLLTARLAGSRKAAVLAALIFLVNPHAQQTLWDISFLHMVLSTPILLASLLAYSTGRRKIAWALVVVALGVDESGFLVIAVVGLYELIVAHPPVNRGNLKSGLLRLAPLAFIAAAYLAARISTGSIYSEVANSCRSPRCLANYAGEYFDRSLLRPDLLLSWLWTHQAVFVSLGLLVVVLVLALTRPWGWSEKRIPAFVVAWWAVAVGFFVLSLPGYIADRFLYVPDCALAVLIGIVVMRASDARPQWSPVRRWAGYAAACALAVWIAAGPWMLFNRGQLNVDGGEQAASILHEIHALVPDPPPGAMFVVRDVPIYASTEIPPGNTGPYLFNTGLDSAIRLEYGRSDLVVVVGRDDLTPAPLGAFVFDIRNGAAVLLP